MADIGPNGAMKTLYLSLRHEPPHEANSGLRGDPGPAPLQPTAVRSSILPSDHPALALASLRSTRAAYRASLSRAVRTALSRS